MMRLHDQSHGCWCRKPDANRIWGFGLGCMAEGLAVQQNEVTVSEI